MTSLKRLPMVGGRPLDTPACPDPEKWAGRAHQVHELGSFGLALGYGYECRTCWTKFTVKPDGELVVGHPPAGPYWMHDFDEEG